MELHFRHTWAKLIFEYVTEKCRCDIENLLDVSNISVKFCITYDDGNQTRGKYKHRVIPNSGNHICAIMTRKYNIVKYSINVYLFGDQCDVTLHCSRCDDEVNFLETEKQLFVDGSLMKMLLVSIHVKQCECFAENNAELYFADDYMLSRVVRYIGYVF